VEFDPLSLAPLLRPLGAKTRHLIVTIVFSVTPSIRTIRYPNPIGRPLLVKDFERSATATGFFTTVKDFVQAEATILGLAI